MGPAVSGVLESLSVAPLAVRGSLFYQYISDSDTVMHSCLCHADSHMPAMLIIFLYWWFLLQAKGSNSGLGGLHGQRGMADAKPEQARMEKEIGRHWVRDNVDQTY